jgi:hypothetical protein
VASTTEVFRGDNGALVVNASGVSELGSIPELVGASATSSPIDNQIMAAMASWVGQTRPPASRRVSGLFDRDRFVNPGSTFDKIKVARDALRDDIIGGGADTTESLALSGNYAYCADLHQQSVWNQILADLDMDSRIREAWRILYTDSQLVCATWWGNKQYKSLVKTERGNQSKKVYDLTVPLHMTYLDTTKVTPIGSLMFNQERLAFIATAEESHVIEATLAQRDGLTLPSRNTRESRVVYDNARRMLAPTQGESGLTLVDPIISRLITGRYEPPPFERDELQAEGIATDFLYAFDPRFVWRHTLTRPQFQRFAEVRLESTFELLDLKHQLRQMDRAHLIGGANYIVLITKGSDAQPGTQAEIDNLKASVRTIGHSTVMVGDNRLKVEIVTPKQDSTLSKERHDTINTQLQSRVYGTFTSTGDDTTDPIKSGRIIAAGLEGRRKMVRRSIERQIFSPICDANEQLDKAKLKFRPETITLAFDPARATFLLDMREARELSRDTLHNELGIDQSEEADLMEREAEVFDPVFKTIVPHGVNPGEDDGGTPDRRPGESLRAYQRRAGRRMGGNRGGGGAAPGTQQGKESLDPRRSDTGPNKRPAAAAFLPVLDLGPDPTAEEMVEALASLQRPELITVAEHWAIPYRHRAKAEALREQITAKIQEADDDDL